jgi:peptidoglycan/xylan/chitin deacetylase (PgdA/CDA1 family)
MAPMWQDSPHRSSAPRMIAYCKALSTYMFYVHPMTVTLKTHITRAILSSIALSGVGNLFPAARGRGVIFTLHHVRPKTEQSFDPNAHLEITPGFLDKAITVAKASGLIPARLEDLPVLLANTDEAKRYVCFTLDDGYRNNAEFAAPVFRKHDMPYTIFICPGFVTRTRTLWWETITAILRQEDNLTFNFTGELETINTASISAKQAAFARFANFVETSIEDQAVYAIDSLARSVGLDPLSIVDAEIMDPRELAVLSTDPLCTLGGHTLTHCNLARVSDDQVSMEISNSCKLVSEYAQQPVKTFAYPYGWQRAAGPREFKAASAIGLSVAVTTVPGVLQSADITKMSSLKRISLNGHFQNKRYISALLTGLPFKFL